MRWSSVARRRAPGSRAGSASVIAALAISGLIGTAGPASAAPASVTLAGDLQSELGCGGDWQPDCAATHLAPVSGTTRWEATFRLPAGTYQYKIAIDDAWTENYGAGGVKDGPNLPLAVAGPVELRFSYDEVTHVVSVTPLDLPGTTVTADDRSLAGRSLRKDVSRERFYFVMTDRFANGTTANDLGGYGSAAIAGFDPTGKGWYHGGDLKGLTSKLDYIKGLGTTAIWLTPSFKNKPVQDNNGFPSAGYHGYWITDFTQIDPHLGTNADLKALIAASHKKGMKVYFDIITNHTADVIDYTQKKYDYIDKTTSPYKDASGTVFDDKAYAGTNSFPALDPATSFPYTPVLPTPADATVKVPAWLNDVTAYHNRGNSTFAGESSEYGDFFGLDDLFTEQPRVVDGMIDIYTAWAEFGVDGFRIDTTKHVNVEFWQKFIPAVRAAAQKAGTPDFFAFGEVFDGDPRFTSTYTTTAGLQATLDFPFQARAQSFVTGGRTTDLRDVFADDDWYTDADSNAYSLPTFLGNHDMGRIGRFVQTGVPGASAAEQLKRDQLAHSLMYLSRGNPVVYYGDEQGFTGDGGDQDARQDMFPSQVASYNDDVLIGSTRTTAVDNFTTAQPLYRWISRLSGLRDRFPALADGAQIYRYSSDAAGIFAFSRIDRSSGKEFVVALNSATTAKTATFSTYSARAELEPVFGGGAKQRTGTDGRVSVTVPALSAQVWKVDDGRPVTSVTPAPVWVSPAPGGTISPLPSTVNGGGRAQLRVTTTADAFSEVTFAWRVAGSSTWTTLGTDDAAPYRVMPDVSTLARGTLVELRAVARDARGRLAASSSFGFVGDPAGGGTGGSIPPVVQPTRATVPGDHNSEMGCAGDWDPGCPQADLTRDPKDDVWKGTWTLPAGAYQYKVALNGTWDENYGAGAVRNGANINYTAPATPVTFYYDAGTHWVTSDAQGPILTAPGDFQSELGCPADWSPDCMRSWLQDPDGDGTYTFRTDKIPAGSYQAKVAEGLSWTVNYGQGGAPNGANIGFTVPDGAIVTFSYVASTHVMTISAAVQAAVPDLTVKRAVWVAPNTIAWPGTQVPAGGAGSIRWRAHWSSSGGLAIDADAVTGGSSATLTYDPAGLPAAVTSADPALAGYLALKVPPSAASGIAAALAASGGQVAVSATDDAGRLVDATGVKAP